MLGVCVQSKCGYLTLLLSSLASFQGLEDFGFDLDFVSLCICKNSFNPKSYQNMRGVLDDGSPTSTNLGCDHGFISEEY